MPKIGIIDSALLHSINKIVKENASLKKQLRESELKTLSKDVAKLIDDWMNQPYQKDKSEWQDINEFALHITRYIDNRLN